MLMKRKTAEAAERFVVPSLQDVSAAYASLLSKQTELGMEHAALSREYRDLERQIDEDRTKEMRPAVAEMLGDPESGKPLMRKRLREVSERIRDIDTALGVLRTRLAAERTKASVVVCAAAKPEYGRCVTALCNALEAVAAARADFDGLIDDFERRDIAWTSLIPCQPTFLGDRLDGHIPRYLRAAKEAGYHEN